MDEAAAKKGHCIERAGRSKERAEIGHAGRFRKLQVKQTIFKFVTCSHPCGVSLSLFHPLFQRFQDFSAEEPLLFCLSFLVHGLDISNDFLYQ